MSPASPPRRDEILRAVRWNSENGATDAAALATALREIDGPAIVCAGEVDANRRHGALVWRHARISAYAWATLLDRPL
jgi:hypothetical protein